MCSCMSDSECCFTGRASFTTRHFTVALATKPPPGSLGCFADDRATKRPLRKMTRPHFSSVKVRHSRVDIVTHRRFVSIDFNSTHCLMNSEVKLLLDAYYLRRMEEATVTPHSQPTAYSLPHPHVSVFSPL